MRREQIHKICLNHILTPEIEYKPKDAKSWQFVAIDFSEGALEPDHFSLRFKTDDIARKFRSAIDDALAGNLPAIIGNDADQPDTASTVTEEERMNIINLKLPSNFYDYTNHAQCTGCRGCNPDEFEFSEVKDTNHLQVDDNPLPLAPPPKVETTHNDLSKDTKKSEASSTFSFSSFGNGTGTGGTDNGFSFVSNPNNTQSSGMFFGNSSFNSPFTSGADKKEPTSTTPAFGQANIFGGNVAKTPSAEPTKSTTPFTFTSSNVFGSNSM